MKTNIRNLLSQRERIATNKNRGQRYKSLPPDKKHYEKRFKPLLPQVIYQIYPQYLLQKQFFPLFVLVQILPQPIQ